MNILIVEDQPEKADDIAEYLKSYYGNHVDIIFEDSLRSGLMRVVSGNFFNLLILDMSMPNFTATANSTTEAEPVSFAGRELIKQMKIREIFIPTIVVTQYTIFEKDNVTLTDLDAEFKGDFEGFYLGSVYYSSSSGEWKESLAMLLENI